MKTLDELDLSAEQKTRLQQAIDEMSLDPDIKSLVARTEAKMATTQCHYGDYGQHLSVLSQGRKFTAWLLAQAMIKAGANPIGVENAFKLFVCTESKTLKQAMGLIPKPEPTTMTPVNLREAMYFFGHTQIFRPPEHPTVDDL